MSCIEEHGGDLVNTFGSNSLETLIRSLNKVGLDFKGLIVLNFRPHENRVVESMLFRFCSGVRHLRLTIVEEIHGR